MNSFPKRAVRPSFDFQQHRSVNWDTTSPIFHLVHQVIQISRQVKFKIHQTRFPFFPPASRRSTFCFPPRSPTQTPPLPLFHCQTGVSWESKNRDDRQSQTSFCRQLCRSSFDPKCERCEWWEQKCPNDLSLFQFSAAILQNPEPRSRIYMVSQPQTSTYLTPKYLKTHWTNSTSHDVQSGRKHELDCQTRSNFAYSD